MLVGRSEFPATREGWALARLWCLKTWKTFSASKAPPALIACESSLAGAGWISYISPIISAAAQNAQLHFSLGAPSAAGSGLPHTQKQGITPERQTYLFSRACRGCSCECATYPLVDLQAEEEQRVFRSPSNSTNINPLQWLTNSASLTSDRRD